MDAGLGAAVAALLVLAAGGSTAAALMIDSARREAEGQRQEARDRAAEADLRADELAATNTRLGAEKQRAEQALADLRQREEEVRTQKRLVGEQEKKVAEQREKVLEYVGFARGTVDHFYRKVSGDPDLKGAGMVALRKDLLEKARKFYERLLDDRDAAGDGVISQEDLADVLLHLAELSREYDSKEAAVKLYREAVAVLEELVKKNVEKLSDLSGGYIGLGQALADTGKPREAEQALASGQRLLERIGRTGEVTPINLTDRASVHVNKANVLTREGKLADARAELDEALKIRKLLANESPENPIFQYELGIAYTSLAAVHGTGKEFDAAYEASRRALDHLDRAGKLGPVLAGDEDYQANLAVACMNCGQSALSTGRVGEAPPLLTQTS